MAVRIESRFGFTNFISYLDLEIGGDQGSPVSRRDASSAVTGKLVAINVAKMTMAWSEADQRRCVYGSRVGSTMMWKALRGGGGTRLLVRERSQDDKVVSRSRARYEFSSISRGIRLIDGGMTLR
jgi:hypothetical protein